MDQRLERILPRVQKPARYTGGEYRQIIKDKAEVDLRLAFCFPDIYEIGMSNIGMRILYATMNQMPGVCPLGRHGGRNAPRGHPALRARERRPRQRI